MAIKNKATNSALSTATSAEVRAGTSAVVTAAGEVKEGSLAALLLSAAELRDRWRGLAEADRPVEGLSSGDGIDTSVVTNSSGKKTITVSAETASTSNAGTVEVATTDEALAGGDQLRSMSPATTEAVVSLVRTTAAGAQATADGAEANAQTAITNAATADGKAVAAQGTADTAASTAAQAQSQAATNAGAIAAARTVTTGGNDLEVLTRLGAGDAYGWAAAAAAGATLTASPAVLLHIDSEDNANDITQNRLAATLGASNIGNFVGLGSTLLQNPTGVIRGFLALMRVGELADGDTNFTVANGGLTIVTGAERGVNLVVPLRIDGIPRSTNAKFEVWRKRGTGAAVEILVDEFGNNTQNNANYDKRAVIPIRNGLQNGDTLFIVIELEREEAGSVATLAASVGQDGSGVQYGYIEAKGGAQGEAGSDATVPENRLLPVAGAKDTIPYKVAADGSAVQFRPAPAGLNASQTAAINQSFLYAFQLVGNAIETASGLVGRHTILVQPLDFAPFNTYNRVRIRVGSALVATLAYDSADTDRLVFDITSGNALTIRNANPNATKYLVEIDFYTSASGTILTSDDGQMQIDQYLRVGADVVSRGLELVWQSPTIPPSNVALSTATLVPIANEESGRYRFDFERTSGTTGSVGGYAAYDATGNFFQTTLVQYDTDEPTQIATITMDIGVGEVVAGVSDRVKRQGMYPAFVGSSGGESVDSAAGVSPFTYLSNGGLHMHLGANNTGNIKLWRLR